MFILVLLIALCVYWYLNEGELMFKTNHVDLFLTHDGLKYFKQSTMAHTSNKSSICKNCGGKIINNEANREKSLCESCLLKLTSNYSVGAERKEKESAPSSLKEQLDKRVK